MVKNDAAAGTAGLKLAAPRSLYFAIFAISGFSGLIYESIWSHYLKLFLGHAAYAQSLVLIIFMGGMAIGAFVASRFSTRSKSPILIYAVVEAVVGVAALLFHNVFNGAVDFVYSSLLPAVGSPALGATLKWLVASVLIVPQSILLGMTFPLMSAGIIRRYPGTPGGSIAMLYFTNSIGAAIGVLTSGFVLIAKFGLPGTVFTAGLLNIALALTVWILVRLDPKPYSAPLPVKKATESTDSLRRLFFLAAFITGAASFIYEISWIRMLSLVLGATTHSFELMLSAFITGLAFGGLWIKRRIDKVSDPVRFSANVQLIMGVFALLTIPVYTQSFDWMNWLLVALTKSDQGFLGFNLASHAIALAVMLPTTFMAGMTLPLFTYVLINRGDGESSIGQIYSANTVGAIVGVIFAVHIGLPLFGVKNLIVFGAALDIGLAILLLARAAPSIKPSFTRFAPTAVGVVAVLATLIFADLDKQLLMSGVYRSGYMKEALQSDVLFYRDGKTATISLRHVPSGRIILSTNGKPDASIQLNGGRPTMDEATMTVAGSLPFAFNPNATRIANIGMGSGQTTHVILGNERIEYVDTIEIESEMVEASKGFGDAVARTHNDPRSRVFIEDAKTYFSLHNSVYDIIIAEPSNPWVSGVASLFSSEFYATILNHLEDDGLFVQWLQLYEFSDGLSESILKALDENFEDYAIYASDAADVLIVAQKKGTLAEPDWSFVLQGELGNALRRVEVLNKDDLAIRALGNRKTLAPYLKLLSTPANSDFYPYVDLRAGKARFLGTTAGSFADWAGAPLPVIEMLMDNPVDYSKLTPTRVTIQSAKLDAAKWSFDKAMAHSTADPANIEARGSITYVADWMHLANGTDCGMDNNPARWFESAHTIATATLSFLNPEQATMLVNRMFNSQCEVAQTEQFSRRRELYSSVALRDGAQMAQQGRLILESDAILHDGLREYALAASMLGSVSIGRADDAHATWEDFGSSVFPEERAPPYVRLILSAAFPISGEVASVATR